MFFKLCKESCYIIQENEGVEYDNIKYFKLVTTEISINMDTIRYCPPNITFNEIWIDHGMSKCFMDSISTSIIFLYLITFGSIQLWIYCKYGTETDENTLPKSKLYNLQKFVLYLIPILSVIRIILQATVLDNGMVYGYMVRIHIYSTIIYKSAF